MINNRQNGRRRGRGGPRPPNGSNNAPERGNRLDNRARGNANQLHEKYKTLARDAQLQGDRVMTEYYLQFADHYFRVLGESRQRFEEQRRYRDDNGDYDEDGGEDGDMNAGYDDDGQQDYRPQQQNRNEGRQNEQRQAGGQGNDGRQNGQRPNDGRQYEARQNDGNRNDGNRNEGRPDEPRQNEGRQNDGRQNEGRQNEGRQDARPRDRQQQEPRRRDNRPNEQRPPEPRQAERPIDGAEHERPSEVRPADPPAGGSLAGEPSGEVNAPAERVRRPRVRRDRAEPPAAEAGDGMPERIEVDRLPPAFTPPAAAMQSEPPADGAEAPRRRRLRRPSTDVAPVDA